MRPADGLTPGRGRHGGTARGLPARDPGAGEMLGKRVLVTGCGPIGTLAILAARCAGAAEIVATDLAANALAHAARGRRGPDDRHGRDPGRLSAYAADKGWFDVLYECSGAAAGASGRDRCAAPARRRAAARARRRHERPDDAVTAKEIDLRGSFRFHEEFATAVALMRSGLIDVKPLITHTLPLDSPSRRSRSPSDRSQAMKAQIAFG